MGMALVLALIVIGDMNDKKVINNLCRHEETPDSIRVNNGFNCNISFWEQKWRKQKD